MQCQLYKAPNNVKVEKITSIIYSKRKKMYVKIKCLKKTLQKQDDRIYQYTKNYEAVKLINWRIAVNGKSTIM